MIVVELEYNTSITILQVKLFSVLHVSQPIVGNFFKVLGLTRGSYSFVHHQVIVHAGYLESVKEA